MKDDIDFIKIFRSIKRNKRTILIFSILSFFASALYILPQKHIWRGEFEVVLPTKKDTRGLEGLDPSFSRLLENNDQEFSTEVSILKSPSVLIPVFELAKTYEKNSSIDNWRFSDWFINLKISTLQGTNILTVTYNNTNKDSILPILESINSSFQQYFYKKDSDSNKKNIEFLNLQINDLKEKTIKNIRSFEDFATKNDLTSKGIETVISQEEQNKLIARSEIKIFSQLLDIIEESDSPSKERDKIFAAILPVESLNLSKDPIFKALLKVEEKLKLREKNFYSNDKGIQILIRQRDSLISELKKSIINKLEVQLDILDNKYKSNSRKDKIFSQYRELNREVRRNEKTLANLENQKNSILLQSQLNEKPLQLIKKPIVEKNPFAPNKKRIVLLGTLFGTFFSILFTYAKDKKRNLIFFSDEIKNILNLPLLYQFDLNENKNFLESTQLIANKINIQKSIKKVALISVGEISNEIVEKFSKNLDNFMGNTEIQILSDLNNAINFDTQILLISLGKVTSEELYQYKDRLKLQGKDVSGVVILNY